MSNFCAINSADSWGVYLGATADDGDATTWWIRRDGERTGICSGIGNVKTSPYYNYHADYTFGSTISKLTLDNTGLYVNDVKATGPQYQNTITPGSNPLYIFAGNSNGSPWRYSSMRISACKIWEGTTKVRDFVAVKRKSDNVLGLFDKVENSFYVNRGSGSFIPPFDPSTISGSATVTVTDTENANARTSCGWVQLWAGGPKWATFNVGASATTYAGMTEYSFANTGGFYSFRGKRNLYADVNGASYGDTAKDLWGTNWRTPTSVEEQALLNNCDFTYCDGSSVQYETGCTLKGWKVTGRGDYASNSIFMPLAGVSDQNQGNGAPYYYNEGQKPGNGGWYWASDGSNRIYLSTTSQSFARHDNPHGCSVRAVLAE